jgi:hypothetical protein
MPAKHARKGTNVVTEEEDDSPVDIDALRQKIATRLNIIVSDQMRRWCSCAEPSCKRARACRAPKGVCSNPKPRKKPFSERHLARSRAMFVRMLESMDRADPESQRPSADKTHKKS